MTATATTTEVEQAYLAYFGRPADAEGLSYWTGQSIATMQAGFADSQEYANLYSGMSNDQRVEQVYQNLLGRASDPAGKAYWVGLLNAGTVTVGTLVTDMLENAQGIDVSTITNRTTFAMDFTNSLTTVAQNVGYNGTAAAAVARAAVSAVTYTDASLEAAKSIMAFDIQAIDHGETPDTLEAANAAAAATAADNPTAYGSIYGVTQTSAANAYALTNGANTVNMVVGSAAVTDTFTSLAGTTALTINDSGTATGALTLAWAGSSAGITSVIVNDSSSAALNMNAAGGTALSSLTLNNTGIATLTLADLGGPLATLNIQGSGIVTETALSGLTGTTLTVNDTSSHAQTLAAFTDNSLTSATFSNTGSAALTVSGVTSSALISIALSAGVAGNITSSSASAVNVTGSLDNSNLTLNITGNGNNTIQLGNGNSSIQTGTGINSISVGVGSNTITVGSHTAANADTFTIATPITITTTTGAVPIDTITGALAGSAAGNGDLVKLDTTTALATGAFTGMGTITNGVAVPTTNTLAGFEAAAISDITANSKGYVGFQDAGNFWIASVSVDATGGSGHQSVTFIELVGVTGVTSISTTAGLNVVHIG